MVDRRAEGAVGAPFQMTIESGKIAEMARAVGARHPDHRAAQATIPPTFLTTQFHWERAIPDSNPWERVQMSKERGMHASQRYVFHGPPPTAGTELTCTSRIERIWEKTGRRGGQMTFVQMVTEYRDDDGTLVAEAIMTAVEPQQPAQKEPSGE